MLRKQMTLYVESLVAEKEAVKNEGPLSVEVFKEEKDYIERHQLLSDELKTTIILREKDSLLRFQEDVYIERCEKETDELLAEETVEFLCQPIHYFQKQLNEFMYLESPSFDLIGVDAISFEADSVFRNYEVMLGLKQPKKAEKKIKEFLTRTLKSQEGGNVFVLMFSANDGLWDLNFSINGFSHFNEDWTIKEAYAAVYELLFKLVEEVENV